MKKYISSFVGFVNDDKGNSYTIGVTVINPNPIRPHYYAAQSAVSFKAKAKAFADKIRGLKKIGRAHV